MPLSEGTHDDANAPGAWATPPDLPKQPLNPREQYNLVTDTVAGPNVRLKDNVYQGLAILLCLMAGAGVGAWLMEDPLTGLAAGGLVGLVAGLLGSGIFLMIYRAVKHARGQHE